MSETLLNEIRAARPTAPDALRERVRSLAAEEPAREPFLDRVRLNWGWRRLVLLAPATVVVALVAGSVIGLTRDDLGGGRQAASSGAGDRAVSRPSPGATYDAKAAGAPAAATVAPEAAPPASAAQAPSTVAPSVGQLQRYQAELRLRVEDVEALSAATKRAQQIAVEYGGSVASLQYDAPAEGVGAAQIVLRIPTARVQGALAQLTALGTILGQRYGIDDLQQQADSLESQLEQTQRQIARILAQLGSPTLSDENRAVLRSRLASARRTLDGLREGLRTTNAEARTATVYVTLTTEEIQPSGDGGSRVDDVKDVLAWEAIALLYVLVVAGPFVLLGLLVWLLRRTLRRREETRLLEQT